MPLARVLGGMTDRNSKAVSRLRAGRPNIPHSLVTSMRAVFPLVVTLFAIAGCSNEGITATASPDLGGTITALSTDNARLATQVASIPTPAPPADLGILAYVQGGDVWILRLPGGEPLRLTTDGHNSEPRWSPSGAWLAYRNGESRVWLYHLDDGESWPIHDGRAVESFGWSSLDDRVAYSSGSELFVEDADGSARTIVLPQGLPGPGRGAQGRVGGFAWGPTGEWIAYEWREDLAEGSPSYRGIWVVSPDGGVRGDAFQGDGTIAGWSADGQHILFWEGMFGSSSLAADGLRLLAVPPEGGEPITIARVMLPHSDFVAVDPSSPARLAVISGGGRDVWTEKELALATLPAGEWRALSLPGQAASSPSWSADGERIAYSAMPVHEPGAGEPVRRALMQRRIWIVDVGTGALRQLTDDDAYRDERPLWSGDRTTILFARLDGDDRASLWLTPAEGGEAEQIVDELTPTPDWFGYYGHIEWDLLFDWWRGSPDWDAALEN